MCLMSMAGCGEKSYSVRLNVRHIVKKVYLSYSVLLIKCAIMRSSKVLCCGSNLREGVCGVFKDCFSN
jgi:hypothetical protein